MRHSTHRVVLRRPGRRLLLLALLAAAVVLSSVHVALAAGPTFQITGRGYGHGIGMSQWGAHGRAKVGAKSYSSILSHYYQGTSITDRYNSDGPVIRVHIDPAKASRSIYIVRSGRDSARLHVVSMSNSANRVSLAGTGTYAITVSNGQVVVSHASGSGTSWTKGKTIKVFSGPVKAASDAAGSEPALVTIVSPSGPWKRNFVGWRGSVEFRPSGSSRVVAVNRVRLEHYLYGVVPRESPSTFHPEALKAQAVAARSYAYGSALSGTAIYCTTSSQVYGGHSKRKSDGSGTAENYEYASTNSAVNATNGRVVTYGGSTVQTFFFASSGGRTANIEDVWVTSDPKPYYSSVSDSYEDDVAGGRSGYPYATSWGTITMSGSTIGSKLRARGYGPSSSSAYVTDVIEQRVTSGHVKYATVVWSNGQRIQVRGDRVRSALGLKSTVFNIRTQQRYVQQSQPGLYWFGAWRGIRDSRLSGGSHRICEWRGASMRYRFTGSSSIQLIARKNLSYGKAEVWLDGKKSATIDLYAPSAQYRQVVWRASGLDPDKPHQVEIKVLRQRNPKSKGYLVSVDAFLTPGARVLTPRFEETDPEFVYDGTWEEALDPALSEGRYTFSKVVDDVVTVGFSGTGLDWITRRNAAYGIAEVWIDGTWQRKVDLYAPELTGQQRVFKVRGLSPGRHLLRIRVRDEKNPASVWHHVGVDALEIQGGGLLGPKAIREQDSNPRITYSGAWGLHKDPKLSGGAYRSTPHAGKSVTIRFRGTSVRWITTRRPSHGKAEVFLDGVSQGVVDLYAPSTQYRQYVWGRSGLDDSPHVLQIKVLGTKNPKSANTYVGFDAIDLMGEVLLP